MAQAKRLAQPVNGNLAITLQVPPPSATRKNRSVLRGPTDSTAWRWIPRSHAAAHRRQIQPVMAVRTPTAPTVWLPAITALPSGHPFVQQTPASRNRLQLFASVHSEKRRRIVVAPRRREEKKLGRQEYRAE